jgi:hypothetical protein
MWAFLLQVLQDLTEYVDLYGGFYEKEEIS